MLANHRKAVEMLRLLDAAVAETVLSHLPAEQAQRLRQLAASPEAARSRQRATVLDEFQRGLQLASSGTPHLAVHHPDGDDDTPAEFIPSGDAIEDLSRLNLHQVAQAIETESPRAAAILLSRLPAERTAEILSVLPDARRDAAVREMNQDRATPQSLAERMAAAVVARAALLPAAPPNRTDRIDRLAAVLRAVPKQQRKQMLDAIREQDDPTAEAIQRKLYTFNDLQSLADRQVQRLLTEVDLTILSTALAGVDTALLDKVLNNLSRRARSSLQEELQFRSAPPPKEQQAAREQIAAVIARIDQEE